MIEPFKPIINDQALLNSYSMEEKARRENADRNKDFYYDKQEQYVNTFNIEASPVVLSLTRPVLDKRCSMLYSRKLIRDIIGPEASINFLEELYSDNDIDNILLQADLLSELTGTVLLSMVKDEEKTSKWRITLWDGANFSAVPDDENASALSALSLIKEVQTLSKATTKDQIQVETLTHQQIWTKDTITYYEGYAKKNTVDNPYGFIPFSAFRGKEVMNQFYGFSIASPTALLNKNINQMVSDLAYTIKLQAANPIALMGFQGGEQLLVQPGKAINLPAGADAKVLELKPQIMDTLETIQFLEQKIYETSSVPEVSIVGSEGSSGRELLVRWYPLVQVFEEKTVRFQKYELDLANTLLAIAGQKPIESITVNYSKDTLLPLDPQEDKIQEDIKLNLTTPSEIIRNRDPNLTEEDANTIIKNNEQENNSTPDPKDTKDLDGLEDDRDNKKNLDDSEEDDNE